jgi:hypothetical protein
MRIVLATPHGDRPFTPLALMYLKGSLVSRGCCVADEIAMLELETGDPAEAIADALLLVRPDVVVCRATSGT